LLIMNKAAILLGSVLLTRAQVEVEAPIVEDEVIAKYLNYAAENLTFEVTATLVTLFFIFGTWRYFYRQRSHAARVALNCSDRITPEEYTLRKDLQTRNETEKLFASKEYQAYKQRRDKGEYGAVELNDDDKVDLSDDSDVDDELRAKH
jgi:hypothetical protein